MRTHMPDHAPGVPLAVARRPSPHAGLRRAGAIAWGTFAAPQRTLTPVEDAGEWRLALLPLAVTATAATVPALAGALQDAGLVPGPPAAWAVALVLGLVTTALVLAVLVGVSLLGWLALRLLRVDVPAHGVLRVVGCASIPLAAHLAWDLAVGPPAQQLGPLHVWSAVLLVSGLASLRRTP